MKRSSMLAAVLSLLALFAALEASAQTWVRKNAAPDPYIRNIRLFGNTPTTGQTTIFAASLANGVVKVVDTGTSQTVTPLNNGLPVLRIRNVAAFSDTTNLYVGIDSHGVYKTTDGGANWVAANGSGVTALGCREVRNLNARSNSEIWVVTGCRHNSGVYRTLDGGATWSRLGAATIPDDATVGSLTFNGTGATTIVVAATPRNGMFRSGDNGTTWARINNGLPAPNGANNISVFNASFLGASSDLLAWVEGHGVYRTTDHGANWSAFGNLPATVHSLGGIVRINATTFFIGSDKGPTYRSTDAGATWSAFGNSGTDSVGRFVRSVAVDSQGRTYLSGLIGLGRTSDSLTFTFIATGEGFVSDAILDPDGKTFYGLAETLIKIPDLYQPFGPPTNDSVDLGAGLPGSTVSGHLAQVKSQPATLYAGLTNFGLYKTTNGGGGWVKLDLPNVQVGTSPYVVLSPSDGQVLYGVPGNKYLTSTGGGIYKSVNGGTSWTDSSGGLVTPEARDVNSLAVHQDAPSAAMIATDDGVYRSSDGGATWSNTLQLFDDLATPLPMASVRYHPFDPTIVYVSANHLNSDGSVRASSGVWKSTNGGSTWAQVLSGKRASSIRVEGSGRVVVMLIRDLSQPAFLASSDGGVTWPAFNSGITDNDGMLLVSSIREQGAKVVFASMTTGLYLLDQRATRLAGISTRANVLTGDNVLIGGFIIGGSLPKTVVVRARGPSLGIPGAMADPMLTIVPAAGGGNLVNDDWQLDSNASALLASGFAPGDPKEAAILVTLNPGGYTAIVGGVGNTTGLAIVEVYEMDNPEVPLVGISTRGLVQTGDAVVIGGFIIQGSAAQTVVVRARGPSLGVTGALADPVLTIVPAAGGPNLVNDNWQTDPNAAALLASGFAPGTPLESAILVTLNPGAYTAIVTGAGNSTGLAIVEVYKQ
jgi:photosystem II stability/assembly factor-like uncharacterized protein